MAALDEILQRMQREPWHVWWNDLARELGQVLDDPSAIQALAATLAGQDVHVRRWFAQRIGEQRPEVIARQLELLLDDIDDDVRVAACIACVRTDRRDEAVRTRLRSLVRSHRLIAFGPAADTLAALDDPGLVTALESVFPCRDYNISTSAAHRLGRLGDAGLAALLRLSQHADPDTRVQALHKLGWRTTDGTDPAISTAAHASIVAALDATDASVRAAAASAVGRLGLADAAPRLLALADAATPDGKAALHALGELTYEPAWPVLVDCLLHDASEPCQVAARALAVSKFPGAEEAICERIDRAGEHRLRWSLLEIVAPIATSRSIPRFEAFLPIGIKSRRLTKRTRKHVRGFIPAWIHKARERG